MSLGVDECYWVSMSVDECRWVLLSVAECYWERVSITTKTQRLKKTDERSVKHMQHTRNTLIIHAKGLYIRCVARKIKGYPLCSDKLLTDCTISGVPRGDLDAAHIRIGSHIFLSKQQGNTQGVAAGVEPACTPNRGAILPLNHTTKPREHQ